jgi:hypothetical protein
VSQVLRLEALKECHLVDTGTENRNLIFGDIQEKVGLRYKRQRVRSNVSSE